MKGLRVMEATWQLVLLAIQKGTPGFMPAGDPLPEDVELLSAHFDSRRGVLSFLLASNHWDGMGYVTPAFKTSPEAEASKLENVLHRGLWEFLTKRVHRGEGTVVLGLTEDGDVGLWLHGEKYPNCLVAADGVQEAVAAAVEKVGP